MSDKVIRQAVILCGGLGVRLGAAANGLPKPMMCVGDKPVLQHTVEHLARHGVSQVIFCAGHRADVIQSFFNEWRCPGVDVTVAVEPVALGTSGPLHLIADKLNEDFLLVYGDVFIDFDVRGFAQRHLTSSNAATLLVRQSDHPWDSDLVVLDERGQTVHHFLLKGDRPELYKNVANAAVYVLSERILNYIPPDRKSDFVADVFPTALAQGETIGVHHLSIPQFVKDMGTPQRLKDLEQYLHMREEIEQARIRKHDPIRTAFIDRDGVLNKHIGLLSTVDQLELLPGAGEAIGILNDLGIRVVVITNQPVLARGLCDAATLEKIHDELRRLVQRDGGAIDGIYYCPHHPETHHPGGVRELRRACNCRKPNVGLIMRAKEELGLRLSECVMIGDSDCDIAAGQNAGIRTIRINGHTGANASADFTFDSLLEAARAIAPGKIGEINPTEAARCNR